MASAIIADDYQKIKVDDRSTYVTLPWMSKYEFDQLVGLRATHIARGMKPLVEVPLDFSVKSNIELRKIAIQELLEKRLPYIIKRPLPNGREEYWPVGDLALTAVMHLMR